MLKESVNEPIFHKFSETGIRKVKLQIANSCGIFWDALNNYNQNSDVNQAAAIAFYAILSLIPLFLLTLLAASQIFGSYPHIQMEITESIKGVHPFFSADLLSNLAQVKEKSRLLGGMGIISLIWLSAMIFGALEKSLNIIFRTRTQRNFFASKLMAFAMIPTGWIVGAASIAITYISTALEKQTLLVKFGLQSHFLAFIARHLLPYLLVVAFITILYRIIPKGKVTFLGAFGGAIIFTTLLELA
ncbi:MAG: YihY/virulence factor BrkB family protein, partial [Syntrophales bacterium LBB04]|nr:YihY/virulence factor BrkB family protein [Syntrophales bacterium LBB04]